MCVCLVLSVRLLGIFSVFCFLLGMPSVCVYCVCTYFIVLGGCVYVCYAYVLSVLA